MLQQRMQSGESKTGGDTSGRQSPPPIETISWVKPNNGDVMQILFAFQQAAKLYSHEENRRAGGSEFVNTTLVMFSNLLRKCGYDTGIVDRSTPLKGATTITDPTVFKNEVRNLLAHRDFQDETGESKVNGMLKPIKAVADAGVAIAESNNLFARAAIAGARYTAPALTEGTLQTCKFVQDNFPDARETAASVADAIPTRKRKSHCMLAIINYCFIVDEAKENQNIAIEAIEAIEKLRDAESKDYEQPYKDAFIFLVEEAKKIIINIANAKGFKIPQKPESKESPSPVAAAAAPGLGEEKSLPAQASVLEEQKVPAAQAQLKAAFEAEKKKAEENKAKAAALEQQVSALKAQLEAGKKNAEENSKKIVAQEKSFETLKIILARADAANENEQKRALELAKQLEESNALNQKFAKTAQAHAAFSSRLADSAMTQAIKLDQAMISNNKFSKYFGPTGVAVCAGLGCAAVFALSGPLGWALGSVCFAAVLGSMIKKAYDCRKRTNLLNAIAISLTELENPAPKESESKAPTSPLSLNPPAATIEVKSAEEAPAIDDTPIFIVALNNFVCELNNKNTTTSIKCLEEIKSILQQKDPNIKDQLTNKISEIIKAEKGKSNSRYRRFFHVGQDHKFIAAATDFLDKIAPAKQHQLIY